MWVGTMGSKTCCSQRRISCSSIPRPRKLLLYSNIINTSRNSIVDSDMDEVDRENKKGKKERELSSYIQGPSR